MRRPLCMAALVYTISVWILLQIMPWKPEAYPEWNKEKVWAEGTIVSKEFKTNEKGEIRLLVSMKNAEVSSKKDGGKKLLLKRMLLCRLGDGSRETAEGLDEELPIGSRILLRGTFRCFPAASNPGEFDAALYYRTMGYTAQLTGGAVTETGMDAKRGVLYGMQIRKKALLYRVKRYFSRVLETCFTGQSAEIMKAMLLGEKGGLDPELKDLYQGAGIVHILAISGLHILMIGMGVFRMAGRARLPIPAAALLSMAVIWLYGEMTGTGPSSARAIVMFLLRMLAKLFRRTYDLLTAVSIAGVLLLIEEPLFLQQSGFLFSFGAVLGIALLVPSYESHLMKGLSVSLAALPVHLSSFGMFPIGSIALNLLVIPFMSTVMAGGLMTLMLGGICPPAGRVTGALSTAILILYEVLCKISGQIPGLQVILGASSLLQAAGYYAILIVIVSSGQIRKMPGKRRREGIRMALTILALFILLFRWQSGLETHAVDVGQGDGILIRADGTDLWIDGGSTDRQDVAKYQLLPLLRHYGVRRLECCILTHEDEDHMNGLTELLQSAGENGVPEIGALCLPSVLAEAKTGNYRKLEEIASKQGIPVRYLKKGDILENGKLRLLCLHPEENSSYAEPNARSTTLYLTYEAFSCLLNGDLEGEGEEQMLRYAGEALPGTQDHPVNVTLLHIAHHGSKGATSEAFLRKFHPQYAYVSCGKDNSYGHPHAETLQRLKEAGVQQIYDTRYDGEIVFRTNGKNLRARTYNGIIH